MNSVGVSCPATVLCLSLEQPRGFQYSYVVNGITYQHFAFQSEFPGIHVGSKIDVHYRRDQPEISSARNTAKELENQIVFDVVTSIALPLALCFLVVERLCRFHLSFIALFGPSGRSTSK
jgi:hypothetical protein